MPRDIETYVDLKKELYRRDFEQFAAEQLWISGTGPGQIIRFMPLTHGQQMLHSSVESQRKEHGWVRVVLIKCRQMGGSTYTAGRAFHLASLNEGVSTLEIAHDGDTASSIFEKCKMYYDRMGDEFKPLRRYDNKTELKFENPDARTRGSYPGLNSKMTFNHAKNLKVGTGTTQHFIHLTEAAKYDTEFCGLLESSLFPGLHLVPGTWCINESTAYVYGDYFRSCCERARSAKSEWKFVFVPWYVGVEDRVPLSRGERFKRTKEEIAMAKLASIGQPLDDVPPWTITDEQFKWRRMIIAGREDGAEIFKQEYPTVYDEAWISLDLNVFPNDKLYLMREHLQEPKYYVNISSGGKFEHTTYQHMSTEKDYLAIWKDPEYGKQYDIGVDTSVGIEGGDWSVAEVFERESREQVAEFHVLMNGPDLSEKLYWLGIHFNMAQISIEMASTGFTVNGGLQRLGYPNLYIWRHRERAFPTLSTYSGWKTNRESKAYMIDMFRSWVQKGQVIVHSHLLWNEMKDYVRIPGSDPGFDQYRGGAGHDDAVMAAGICLIAGDDENMGLRRVDTNPDANLTRRQLMERELASGGPAFHDTFGEKRPTDSMKLVKESLVGWDK